MAEEKEKEDGEEQAAAPAETPKSGKRWLLIAGGIFLLLIAAGVPTVFLLLKSDGDGHNVLPADAAHDHPEELIPEDQLLAEEDELGDDEERLGVIFPLETFVVNLDGGGYLRAQVQVEFVDREIPRNFMARLVPIRDGLIGLITEKTSGDLASGKGKDLLKREIKELINENLRAEQVKRVYFTQFVIQ